jgi:hypothetical protein
VLPSFYLVWSPYLHHAFSLSNDFLMRIFYCSLSHTHTHTHTHTHSCSFLLSPSLITYFRYLTFPIYFI